jgi:hypothetical protein
LAAHITLGGKLSALMAVLGLAIDWTSFDTMVPTGGRRYQVLRIAVPRRGRALPLVQLAYDRDDLPAGQSQNQLEETALLAAVHALPFGVEPVILAARGFARAIFLEWLPAHQLDEVVRRDKGTCVTPARRAAPRSWTKKPCRWARCTATRWCATASPTAVPRSLSPLGPHLAPAAPAPAPRPTDPAGAAAVSGHPSPHRQAIAWYRQRFWIEESFKESMSRFRLTDVWIGCPHRLTRLLMAGSSPCAGWR